MPTRPQRTTPPPIPALRRAPTGTGAPTSASSSANITMPLDPRDILAALEDEDEQTPAPGPAPRSPQ